MSEHEQGVNRRGLLRWIINAVVTGIGAVLAVIVGGAVGSPSFRKNKERWLPAGRILGLQPEQPKPVTLRVVRKQGYYEAVDHEVVFLIRGSDGKVTAMSSICTHLGCHVSWDPQSRVFRCPCHGGVYDISGKVIAGPPPRPLATYSTRIDPANNEVFVEL